MVENCSVSSHIQPHQIFDLTDLSEKIWLFGKFEEYRFEVRNETIHQSLAHIRQDEN
jgi:hypothetical protein